MEDWLLLAAAVAVAVEWAYIVRRRNSSPHSDPLPAIEPGSDANNYQFGLIPMEILSNLPELPL